MKLDPRTRLWHRPLWLSGLFVFVLPIAFTGRAAAGHVVVWGSPTNAPAEASDVDAVSAGSGYSLGITSRGTLVDWGNDPGSPPAGLNNVLAVAASHGHSLALKRDGTIAGWGLDYRAWAWTIPAGLTNVIAISANGDDDGEQSLALTGTGTVVAWGNVTFVPDGLSNVVAVAAGGWHEVALKNDGIVVAWGDDTYGQTDVPTNLNNVVAISAGDFHSLALRSDQTVVAWGWDGEGELDQPDGLTNVVAISAGAYDSIALKSDGTVVAWGATYPPINSGQTNVPVGLTNAVAISAGAGHGLAIVIPLEITSIAVTNQSPSLLFHTFLGQQYQAQYSSDLVSGIWSDLPGGAIPGNGQDAWVTDTNGAASAAARFYRLKQ